MNKNFFRDFPKRKRSMTEEKEREYYEFLFRLVEDEEIGLSQQEILEHVKDEGYKISQSVLSNDLKALNIVPVYEQGRNVYRYREIPSVSDVPVEFYNYVNGNVITFSKNINILKIPVKRDFELSVCKKLISYFNKSNIICIPAFESVCVISNSKHKDKLDEIKDVINKEYNTK